MYTVLFLSLTLFLFDLNQGDLGVTLYDIPLTSLQSDQQSPGSSFMVALKIASFFFLFQSFSYRTYPI